MHGVFRNILQFNLVYLSYNTNTLPYLKIAKVSNLCYNGIRLFFVLVFYLNKYPVVGWK